MNLLKTLSTKVQKPQFQEGFASVKKVLSNTKGHVTRLLDNVFRPYEHDGIKTHEFKEGLSVKGMVAGAVMSLGASVSAAPPILEPLVPLQDTQANSFLQFDVPKQKNKFEDLQLEHLSEGEVEKPLFLREFKRTNVPTPKPILIERKTKVYSMNGVFAESFPKGTFVEFDNTKPVIVAPDGKTYSQTLKHDNTPDGSSVFERLLIRTPSMDETIRVAKRAEKESARTTVPAPKKNLFSGYIGYNGKELPAYVVENMTINYFGKVIGPKVQANIAKVETEIVQTREQIKDEVLRKKVNVKESTGYIKQQERLAKKGSLTQINQAIQSFVVNGAEALVNPDVEKLLLSLKKTPEWQKILLQATAAENAKIRNRYQS